MTTEPKNELPELLQAIIDEEAGTLGYDGMIMNMKAAATEALAIVTRPAKAVQGDFIKPLGGSVEFKNRVSYLQECYRNMRAPTLDTVEYFKRCTALTPESEGIAGKVEPVVWWHVLCDEDGKDMMHEFTFDKENPFDKPYRDYSSTWSLKSYPLYNHPTLTRPQEIDIQSREKDLMAVIADLHTDALRHKTDEQTWHTIVKHASIIAEAQAQKGE